MVLSDSAANMRKAFEDEEWRACFQHILALAVKHTIFQQSGVSRLLKKIKTLVKKLRTPIQVSYIYSSKTMRLNSILKNIYINSILSVDEQEYVP